MQDLSPTILSQFANSNRLMALIEDFNQYVDPTYNFDQFFYNIWDIATANGYGLDVLGRIVGVTRIVQISNSSYIGFEQQSGAEPLGQAPLFNPFVSGDISSNFNLTDPAFRTLIMAKSLSNLTNCSSPSINAILTFLFITSVDGRTGQAYCTDPGGMQMQYVFSQLNPPLAPVELAIIGQSGVLPRASGVKASVVQIS